jgi:catechol 2,3-dioxygenase-like lactoylglutathione lyase family enzyme
MEINGIAHTMLTVSDYDACKAFYAKLLPFLGFARLRRRRLPLLRRRPHAFGIQKGDAGPRKERFVQARVGLHHVCFRAGSAPTSRSCIASWSSWARRSSTRRRTAVGAGLLLGALRGSGRDPLWR